MAFEEEYDESFVPPKEPHKPNLQDGKRYVAKITKFEVLKDQPMFNDPLRVQDQFAFTFTIEGNEIKKRVTKSTAELSNLSKIAREFGYGDISKTGFSAKELVGKSCRVKVIHSKPSVKDGSVWDQIDVDTIEALEEEE